METIFSYTQLNNFCIQIFEAIGCSNKDAILATETLLSADLRGVDSHGIARLSGYVRLQKVGRVNPTPNISITHETPSTAVVDGDSGLGLVVAPYAMQVAIDKAHKVGTGWVSVNNSNHYGIAGKHAMMALPHDMIGIAMTNASPLVAPTYSSSRLLGTNPIAVAIPAGTKAPFVGDFATTTAANGKLEILQRKNEAAPIGWIQDKEGNVTTNPLAVKEGGALLPLGGTKDGGSHKGYILGSIVDIFSAVLSGANYGPWVPPFVAFLPIAENMPGKGIGHFFGAMRIDAFRPATDFKHHMDNWIHTFKHASTVNPSHNVVIPGEPEAAFEKKRIQDGIPLLQPVVDDLLQLSKEYNVPLQ
jgi:L-2-hydroxycarboxylate dehydrogenase (NAD+)